MGKKKGKKTGGQPKTEKAPGAEEAVETATLALAQTSLQSEAEGAVGGDVPPPRQQKKKATPEPESVKAERDVGADIPLPQQGKGKKKKATPEPEAVKPGPSGDAPPEHAPPPEGEVSVAGEGKKKKQKQKGQKPQIQEPEGFQKKPQQKRQQGQEPPAQDQGAFQKHPQQQLQAQPPPGFGRAQPPGFGRGQPSGFGRGEFPELDQGRQAPPGVKSLATSLPPAWGHGGVAGAAAARGPSPPQEIGPKRPPPGISGPPVARIPPTPAQFPGTSAVSGPQEARAPPVQSQRGVVPAQKGPSPPQEARALPVQSQRGVVPAQKGPSPPQQVAPPRAAAPVSGKFKIPVRKNLLKCGTKGKPIVVETNHLGLNLSKLKNKEVVHYDVTLNPALPKRLLRPAMEEFRRRTYPSRYPAFDGRKNLYSSGFLDFGNEISGDVEVLDPESQKNKSFNIVVKFASRVDLTSLMDYMRHGCSLTPPQEAIQAIDVVLRCAPAFRFVQVGRSFFTPPRDQIVQLGDGLELWYGFFQSAILGWKPFVNIDVAHKGFPKSQPVVPHLVCDLLRCNPEDLNRGELQPRDKYELKSYLKGLKIDYMIPNAPNTKRTFRVNDVVQSAANQTFKLDNGQTMTVADYFVREKRVRLYYPNMPCLHVGSVNREKPIYVPAELCCLTRGQVINRKMNEIQTSNMIRQAATSTDVRKKKILDAIRNVQFNEDPHLREFGLSVNSEFEKVPARILDPPQLMYNEKKRPAFPNHGVWRPNEFISSKDLSNWMVLNLNSRYTRDDQLGYFATQLCKMGDELGMKISMPLPPTSLPFGGRDQVREIRNLEDFFDQMKKNKMQLVVVVIPDKGDAYAKVKQVAELRIGVLTQCIKAKTMQRMNPATCSNILLKINSKLNGINHTFAQASRPRCLQRPAMIVGADVTHPSPDQENIPSVAAVCASHDPKAFQYNIQIRLQEPKVEIIKDLENIMKEHLIFFYKQTKLKPERIIFFRDGVSEGQFSQVLNEELNAIRRACSSLQRDYQPKITFLVVQKRHHTRFFPTRPEDSDGRNRNVLPGTIVDTNITHPTEVDFYLVSHASIQGVSRPTKYRLLWNDDESMDEDEIELVTYYLCHMFSRCTRTVSYPAPTYNAHLAAYRARVYVGDRINLDNLPGEQIRCTVKPDILQGHPMFFV